MRTTRVTGWVLFKRGKPFLDPALVRSGRALNVFRTEDALYAEYAVCGSSVYRAERVHITVTTAAPHPKRKRVP